MINLSTKPATAQPTNYGLFGSHVIFKTSFFKRYLLGVLFIILGAGKSFAGSGIFESYAIIGSSFFDLQNATANPDFQGASLGSFSIGTGFTLNGEIKTFKNGADNICGGRIYYSIYPATGTPGTFTQINLPFQANLVNSGDQQWGGGTATTISLNGLAPGAYKIAVYVTASGDGSGACTLDPFHTSNNSGANWIANFNITAPTAPSPNNVTIITGAGAPVYYATMAAAITALNAAGTATATTNVYVNTGYAETAPAGGYVIGGTTGTVANGTATNQIFINGNGATFTAATGLTSGAYNDAVFKIIGSDYITLDNLKIRENASNTASTPATNLMTEWGIALIYASTTNAPQNITIKNNDIQLNKTYVNTWLIYANNTHSNTAPSTVASGTTAAGSMNNIVIQSNTLSNANNGIAFCGPTAAADYSTGLFIGGNLSSLGNIISNIGGVNNTSTFVTLTGSTMYGIHVKNAIGFNVSNNNITIPAANVAGTTGTVQGIVMPTNSNASVGTFTNTVNSNTISLGCSGTGPSLNGIVCATNQASPNATLNLQNNILSNFAYTNAAPTGFTTFISMTAPFFKAVISGNTASFASNTLHSTGGITFISHSQTIPANGVDSIYNNTLTGFTKSGAGGTITGFTSGTSSPNSAHCFIFNNTVANINTTNATASTTSFIGINNTDGSSSSPVKIFKNNNFSNINLGINTGSIQGISVSYLQGAGNSTNTSLPTSSEISVNNLGNYNGTGSITGLNLGSSYGNTTAGSVTVTNNTINTYTSLGAATSVVGITSSNTSLDINIFNHDIYSLTNAGSGNTQGIAITGSTRTNVYKNKIRTISGTNATPVISGLANTAGTLANFSNNYIGNLTATNANATNAVFGLNASGGSTVNAYFNTIYLDATSTGTNFGSTGLNAASTNFRSNNNIIHNASTANGTGLTVAFRKATATAYDAASNNNDYVATNLFYDGTTAQTTLAGLKTAVGGSRDAGSYNFTPTYVSTTPSDATYLHINTTTPTPLESGGVTIAGITDDYDGDTRNATTPDVGADEFSGTPLPVCNGTPAAANITGATSVCPGSSTNLALSSVYTDLGITYQWQSAATSGGPYTNLGTSATQATGVLAANTYFICTITCSGSGLSYTTPEYTVITFSSPTVVATPASGAICNPGGTAVSLTASGASTYAWSPATGLSATTGATVSANPANNTNYVVTGTDANGCTSTTNVSISVGLNPSITAITATPVAICAGGSSTLNVAAAPFGITTYTATVSNSAYSTITGTSITFSDPDDASTAPIPVGFNFVYNNTTYTNVGVTTNGYIILGASASGGSFFSNALATTANIIAPLWDDNNISGGTVQYLTTGTAPNRTFTVQWTGLHIGGGSNTSPTINMQLNLNETSNSFNFIYGATSAAFLSTSASIGFSGASGVYVSVTPTSTSAVTLSSSLENTSISSATNFPTGTKYTFASPVPSYLWSPSTNLSATNIVNPIASNINGTSVYSVTATNGACAVTSSVTISANPLACNTPTLSGATNCVGVQKVNANITGGGAPYLYSWKEDGMAISASTASINASAGTHDYEVTVSDACGNTCTSTIMAVFTESYPIVTAAVSSPVCLGSNFTVTGTASPSTTYTWSGPSSFSSNNLIATITNSSTANSGIYTLTAANNACIATSSIQVVVLPVPTELTATAAPSSFCAGGSTTLTASAFAPTIGVIGTGTLVTQLSSTTSTNFPNPYSHFYGGTKMQMLVTATELSALGLVNGSKINSIGFPVASVNRTDGLIGFQIDMGLTNINAITSFQGGLTNVLAAATYSTNATPGVNTHTITPFTWDGTSNLIIQTSFSNNDGPVSGNVTMTYGTRTYNASIVYRVDNATAATVAGFTGAPTFTLQALPNITINGTVPLASSNLAWSPAGSLNTATGSPVIATPSSNTQYTVTATISNGCTASASTTITVNPAPALSITPSSISIWNGQSTALTASGADTYTWMPGSLSGAMQTLSPTTTTTYTVTGTNTLTGCTTQASATVNVYDATVNTNNPDCFGQATGTADLSILPALSGNAVWSISPTAVGTNTITNNNDGTFEDMPAGTYTISVTDGPISLSTAVSITEPAELMTTYTVNNVSCNGGTDASITLNISGGTVTPSLPYSVDILNVASDYDGAPYILNGTIPAGIYTIFIDDNNGCISQYTVTVTEPPVLNLTLSASPILCNGGTTSVTATATGGTATYTITPAQTNLAAGTYTFTATDANGCTSVSNITLTEPASAVTLTASAGTIPCGGTTSITASAGGGTGTVTISGFTNPVGAGSYTVVATDENMCTSFTVVTIAAPSAITVMASASPILCNGGATTATVTATGGTGTLNGTGTFSITAGGTYSYVVTDANGCTGASTVVVANAPSAVVINASGTQPLCFGQTGSITFSAMGGTGTITFTLNGSNATSPASGLNMGTYTLVATDANGCSTNSTISINAAPSAVSISAMIAQPLCFGQLGSYTFSASGGTGNINYMVNMQAATSPQSNVAAGTYTIIATDANGCTASSTVVINMAPSAITLTVTPTQPLCAGQLGSYIISATGGTGTKTYTVNGNAATSPQTNVAAGTYTIIATDANGCTTNATVTINAAPSAITFTTNASQPLCFGQLGSYTFGASGGTGSIGYKVNNVAATSPQTNVAAGTYTIQATDANACTKTTTVVINAAPALIATSANITNCITYTLPWGTTVTTSGTYTNAYIAANGCDSIRTYNVTITQPSAPTNLNVIGFGSYNLPWGTTVTTNGTYTNMYQNVAGCDSLVTINVSIQSGVQICAKVILNGAYDSATALMRDDLRTLGIIPTTSPYGNGTYTVGYNIVGNAGGETAASSIFTVTGNNAIVDWVFLQLRSAADSSIVIETKSALVQRDGDIVDGFTGMPTLVFGNTPVGNYFVSVKHRNHIGVMTKNTYSLGNTIQCFDFTNLSLPLFTRAGKSGNPTPLTGAAKMVGSVRTLYGGNCNINTPVTAAKFITYNSTVASDRAALLTFTGSTGSIPGYTIYDCDLNGTANFNGINPDRFVIFKTCLGSNVIIVNEQMP
jgi:hypothetical protein